MVLGGKNQYQKQNLNSQTSRSKLFYADKICLIANVVTDECLYQILKTLCVI
jgi:hypothetical protein